MTQLPNHFDEAVAAAYDDDGDERWSAEHLALECGFLAELAGAGGRALELAKRWAWWDRAPFTADSRSHVSVWERS